MRALNRAFRGKDYATDVLSFPVVEFREAEARASALPQHRALPKNRSLAKNLARPTNQARPAAAGAYLGDIAIASGVANRQADQAGHSVATELRVLALHGLLHLLGYDHETDGGHMARAEGRLRKKAGLDEGLISRVAPRPGRRAAAPMRSR